MSNLPSHQSAAKKIVIAKCWDYLNDNFHKFNDTNKLKVSIEICKKDMPTQLEGQTGQGTLINIINPTKKEDVRHTLERIPG